MDCEPSWSPRLKLVVFIVPVAVFAADMAAGRLVSTVVVLMPEQLPLSNY